MDIMILNLDLDLRYRYLIIYHKIIVLLVVLLIIILLLYPEAKVHPVLNMTRCMIILLLFIATNRINPLMFCLLLLWCNKNDVLLLILLKGWNMRSRLLY